MGQKINMIQKGDPIQLNFFKIKLGTMIGPMFCIFDRAFFTFFVFNKSFEIFLGNIKKDIIENNKKQKKLM